MKLLLVFVALVSRGLCESCDPSTCMLPNCRCYNDPDPPGKLSVSDIPQVIIVTFENAMNDATIQTYLPLFELVNPNGCAARGTFFVQDTFTDYAAVKDLYDQGHEIGVNLLGDTIPIGSDWKSQIKKVLDGLAGVGISLKDVRGVRAPRLSTGGDDQFIGMGDNGLVYDASCANLAMSKKTTMVWPFTLDHDGPSCDIGEGGPNLPFPGKWEIMVGDLEWKDKTCAVPSGCDDVIIAQQDAFDIFFVALMKHYQGKRTPFHMIVDPAWAKSDIKRAGTVEFLNYIRAAFSDIWIVTAWQALQWIQNPVATENITDFAPWQCS